MRQSQTENTHGYFPLNTYIKNAPDEENQRVKPSMPSQYDSTEDCQCLNRQQQSKQKLSR